MAKLIPGKVRSQGSLLYEDGKVSLQEVKEKYLYFRVEEESLRYSLDDDAVFCSCAFFQKKKILYPSGSYRSLSEEWWQWESCSCKSWRRRHCNWRNSGEGLFWKFIFRSGASKNREKKKPAISYQLLDMKTTILVNFYGLFAFVACQTSVLMWSEMC